MINNVITAYTYDGAGQLRSERKTGAVVSADIYWYDASGNRTLKNEYRPNADGNLTSRFIRNTYNSMNQLIESVDSETGEVTSYTYDEYGNLANDGTYEYLYDSYNYNRLWSTSNIKTKKHVLYDYYYDGLRKSKGNTFYIWLDGNMVYEFTSDDSSTYTYGHRLLSSDDAKYVLNAHGDVVALLNDSGEVAKRYDYDAFGNELSVDTSDTNPFRYCAEYFDKEYGQIYLRNRYYLPVVGRFTQLDPIKDGLNWYAYCGNNPVVFVDPSGLIVTQWDIEHCTSDEIKQLRQNTTMWENGNDTQKRIAAESSKAIREKYLSKNEVLLSDGRIKAFFVQEYFASDPTEAEVLIHSQVFYSNIYGNKYTTVNIDKIQNRIFSNSYVEFNSIYNIVGQEYKGTNYTFESQNKTNHFVYEPNWPAYLFYEGADVSVFGTSMNISYTNTKNGQLHRIVVDNFLHYQTTFYDGKNYPNHVSFSENLGNIIYEWLEMGRGER